MGQVGTCGWDQREKLYCAYSVSCIAKKCASQAILIGLNRSHLWVHYLVLSYIWFDLEEALLYSITPRKINAFTAHEQEDSPDT